MNSWTSVLVILFLIFIPNLWPPAETIKTLHIPDAIMCDYEKSIQKKSLSIFEQNSCGNSVNTVLKFILLALIGCCIGMALIFRDIHSVLMLSSMLLLTLFGSSLFSVMDDALGIENKDKRATLQKLIDDHQWEKAVNFVDTLGVPVSDTQKAYMRAQALFLESKPDQAKVFTEEVFNDINNPKLMAKPGVMYVLEKSAFGVPKSQIALSVAR